MTDWTIVMTSRPKVILSDHAHSQASRRGIAHDLIMQVAEAPQQCLRIRHGREIRQARVNIPPGGKLYLLRLVIDVPYDREEVVTVYKTSKIEKYWRRP